MEGKLGKTGDWVGLEFALRGNYTASELKL